jgi:hypothetical protein
LIPKITKHFSLGILVGTGLGLAIARTLAESGVALASVPGHVLNFLCGVAFAIGWSLYRSDLRRSRVAEPAERA